MQARMKNPASTVPGAMQAIQSLIGAIHKADLGKIMELVHLRASQINGCGPCAADGALHAKRNGETDERLFAVATWRETPYFTPPERAALDLAEAMTRLADRADPVPDGVWQEATRHFGEKELSAVILWVAVTNLFNRLNVTTKQIAGAQSW